MHINMHVHLNTCKKEIEGNTHTNRWQKTAILKGRIEDDIHTSFFIVLYYFDFNLVIY